MKAIIIGAGISGMGTALFLKKAGISCEVFESGPEAAAVAGGLGIAPNGIRILDALGLSEEVINSGTIIKYNWFKNAAGKTLAKIKFTDPARHDQPGVSIGRHQLVQILRTAAANQGIKVNYHKKLQSIEKSDKCVAVFEDESTAHGDILIGADGIRSNVRKCLLPDAPSPQFMGIISSGGFVSSNQLKGLTHDSIHSLNFVYGQNGFFGFGGSGGDKLMWWTNISADKPYSKDELINFNADEEKNTLLKLYGKYTYPVREIIESSERSIRINIFDIQSLPKWSSGDMILIGDAAHAVSPNSGQGASMALEDGMMLAKLLRDEPDINLAF